MSVAHTTWTSGPTITRRVPITAGQDNAISSPSRLMTVKEVAAACQLSEKAIRRAIDDGELSAVKLRSRLRITPDDFQAWIVSQREPRTQRIVSSATRRSGRPTSTGTFRAMLEVENEHRGLAS